MCASPTASTFTVRFLVVFDVFAISTSIRPMLPGESHPTNDQ
jgi:hypothetical protein